jgi:hypothetical protein
MIRWLKEPLLHFFIAGALLFAAAAYFAPEKSAQDSRLIEVTAQTREFLRARFLRVWQREPNATELQAAVDDWIKEEILFREGMQLGLAENDPLARKRIGQKLMMLADALIPAVPEDEILQSWYASRSDNYIAPLVFSFEQRFFAPGANTEDAVERAFAALAAMSAGGGDLPGGDPTLLQPSLDSAPASYIESSFGAEFAAALADLPVGSWQGPVISTFGAHLVFLQDRHGGTAQDFAAVRDLVARDWLYEQSNATREQFYEELRASYRIEGVPPTDGSTR